MSATDFVCPSCNARVGHVCRDSNGLSRWGRPHHARKLLHTAEMRKRYQSAKLYMRLHVLNGGAAVEYSTDNPSSDNGMLLYTHTKPLRRSCTATDTQRHQWLLMEIQGVVSMMWEARVEYRIYTIAEMHAEHGYAIVYGRKQHSVMDYRVVNLRNGEESMLYSLEQCREIIQHAVNDESKGSFT